MSKPGAKVNLSQFFQSNLQQILMFTGMCRKEISQTAQRKW
jgi:hypothetical protein